MTTPASRPCTGSSGPQKIPLPSSTHPKFFIPFKDRGEFKNQLLSHLPQKPGSSGGWALNGTKWLNAHCVVAGASYILSWPLKGEPRSQCMKTQVLG